MMSRLKRRQGGGGINKLDRVRLTIEGRETDHIPYSLWTHFPGIDLDACKLAEETYGFYRKLDLDFLKNMSNGMFSIEDWNCICDFSQVPLGGVAKVVKLAVDEPADWQSIKELDINQGALGRELKSLELLLRLVNGEAPVLATVFSPLTTAQKLSGSKVLAHIKTHPKEVKAALEVIADSTRKFAARALELGCAGVYFASQLSTFSSLDEAAYAEFGVTYDLKILQAIQRQSWFNVMHIHGDNIMFDLLKDYPVNGISWHIWETLPTVEQFLAAAPGQCMVGGLQRFHITNNKYSALAEQIVQMKRITGGKRLFLAPGCVIRAPLAMDTLQFIADKIRTGIAADLAGTG